MTVVTGVHGLYALSNMVFVGVVSNEYMGTQRCTLSTPANVERSDSLGTRPDCWVPTARGRTCDARATYVVGVCGREPEYMRLTILRDAHRSQYGRLAGDVRRWHS